MMTCLKSNYDPYTPTKSGGSMMTCLKSNYDPYTFWDTFIGNASSLTAAFVVKE